MLPISGLIGYAMARRANAGGFEFLVLAAFFSAIAFLISGLLAALHLAITAFICKLFAPHEPKRDGTPYTHCHCGQPTSSAGLNASNAALMPEYEETTDYWPSPRNGIRHNKTCKFFKNSKGRHCEKIYHERNYKIK